ncbi:unnamed protein product [Cochlearia groenlandica]
MSQSLSLARRISYFISNTIPRRGYSANISQGESKVIRRDQELKQTATKTRPEKPSWIPDPITGYYRPDTGLVKLRSSPRS